MHWFAALFLIVHLSGACAQIVLAPPNLGPPRPPNALLAVRNLGFLGDGFHPRSKDPAHITAASKVGKESFGAGFRDLGTAAQSSQPSTKQVKTNKSKLTNAHVRFVVIRAAPANHLQLSQVVVLDESGTNVALGKACAAIVLSLLRRRCRPLSAGCTRNVELVSLNKTLVTKRAGENI